MMRRPRYASTLSPSTCSNDCQPVHNKPGILNGNGDSTAGLEDVEGIQKAISSGKVTAAELCMAYINR
jgi:hypothetical protein